MKIVISGRYDTRLGALNFGDLFELYGEFYMLTNTNGRMSEVVNSPKFCCVRLTDGECVLIDSAEKVHLINATLQLEDANK